MSDTTREVKRAAPNDMLSVSKAYVALPAEKRRLFRAQLRERGIHPQKLPIVPFPKRGNAFALSHAQERMWFLWRLDPSSAAYNITGAVRLKGALDRDALLTALGQVVERHESLRTRFADIDGVPMQTVGPAIYDWREHEAADASALDRTLEDLTNEPFDLEHGSPLRVALVRCTADEYVLHVALHHIVSDGLSIGVFIDEFARAYRLACGVVADDFRIPSQAIQQAIQYGDSALWQREWLDAAVLDEQLSYWRARLGHKHPILELPLSRPRGGTRSTRGAQRSMKVDGRVADGLRRVARGSDATLFMMLLAVYDLLLARYSGQDDIRVGVPVSGRDREETRHVIGFFVNTLVLRVQLQGVVRFSDLLAQVRDRMLEAQAHQDVPFARLVEALQPQRSLSHTPIFQTMFNYLGADREPVTLPGLIVSEMPIEMQTSRFDLVLSARERREGLEVSLTYARDLFDEATIERMLGHYVSLLEQIAAKGDAHLGELELAVADASVELAAHAFVPVAERIVARASAQPQANALHCEGKRLSYGELDAWSNRIARSLHEAGARAETRVGLCLTRSVGMVAALVGVMKSGAAFVPLDPAYPGERLLTMMDDAEVGYVLTDAATLASCADLFTGRRVLDINALSASAAPFVAAIHPEQLAYVIYTSGSTGRPKGVAVSHVSLSRHLDDFIQTYGIEASDTQLQSSTINFDVALHEMLPALMQGGQLEMRGAQLWDIETTSAHLAQARVTFARIPTAYWQQWLRKPPEASALASLRQITVGGEGLPGDALGQWRRGPLAHIRLDNLYGPTETTVACMYRETRAEDVAQTIVSIGEPYASRRVVVLDGWGNEVPAGGLGELCIGGLTLARGYLGRAGLSAEQFVPDPRGEGARLYRSGDLCRRRVDGGIDFLGRLDQQVKLRGFRIELGEIEAGLRQVPGVSEAVVALTGEGEASRLVGYVTQKVPGEVDESSLRRGLEARLPGYMVPSSFVALERLPLMHNGKVDRGALPAPGVERERERVAPRTALERSLLGVWQEVLKRDELSVTDNFFEVGGHSLLVMQVASRVRQELGREVSLQTLFVHPVLASLAAQLEAGGVSEGHLLERIEPRASADRIPLTHAQERLWFLWNLEPASAAYTIAGAVRLRGALDEDALRHALQRLVERHESLRTRFVEEEGQTWQVVDAEARYGWRREKASDNTSDNTPLDSQLLAYSREPFDLSRDPMLRVTLMIAGPHEAVLHFAMPHIVSDAWSQAILLREFSQLYSGYVHGKPVELETLPIQYGDFALWQRKTRDAAALDAQYAYWEAELGGAGAEQPLLELPVDRVRHGVRDSAGARVERTLSAALTQALEKRSREHDATRFMTMLTAFGVLLHRYGAQNDLRIGVPVAGRDRLETERLIGFFVNTLVIRVMARGTQGFDTLLADVRKRVLGAQAHADVPFAQLVERLQPQRSVSHTPLFQALFNYSEQRREQIELPGIEVQAQAGGTGTAQFDLSLEVTSEGECLRVAFAYATDIFEARTVERLLDDYVAVLEQVAQDPRIKAAELALSETLVDEEVQERTELADYAFVPVAERIAAQAARTPQAIAIRCGEHALSYAQLDAWSNAIAADVRKRGANSERCIGVCVSRTVGMVAAVLGVLKSGAAYVPLDPSLPAGRLAYMLDDAGLECVLADAGPLAQHGELFEGRDTIDIAQIQTYEAQTSPGAPIHPTQLAYVIYTSGSTGQPKGVGISHEALDRFLASMHTRLGIDARDVWLSVTTLSFDIAALELYLPLLTGARIELARREEVSDGARLAELLERSKATTLQATPMGWKVLLEGGGPTLNLRGLKALCGGEALPRELAIDLQGRGVQLWNMYGPTETTIWSSMARLSEGNATRITLGEAIEGTTLVVIDASGARVPPGGIGELCIGGTNLARGYLKRAGLSAERFVPDPRGNGERLYRTGDLCRLNAAGELVYVGRADHQVKLRGFRIELGEIEAVLKRDVRVRDAAAAVKGEALLVGYVVTQPGATLEDEATLRAQLAEHLPAYMVPQRIVVLDALPVTHNYKLDRNALPLPDPLGDAILHVEPRTATEAMLADIWKQVLKATRVSITDDFFALGGDSLATLKVARLARDAQLPVAGIGVLFSHPKLADLAAHIDAQCDTAQSASSTNIVPMNSLNAPVSIFAIHPAYGLVAKYRELAQHLDGIASVYGVQSPLYSDATWWTSDLESLANDYAERIRTVQPEGPYRLLGWSMGGLLAIEIAARLEALDETVEFIGLVDAGMQDRVDHDDAIARSILRKRRDVTQQDIDNFWSSDEEARHEWKSLLGPAADDPELIGTAVQAIEQLKALTGNWHPRCTPMIEAPLTVWWASENNQPELEVKTHRWRACSSGATELAGIIETDHPGIVRHPALFADLADRLTRNAALNRT